MGVRARDKEKTRWESPLRSLPLQSAPGDRATGAGSPSSRPAAARRIHACRCLGEVLFIAHVSIYIFLEFLLRSVRLPSPIAGHPNGLDKSPLSPKPAEGKGEGQRLGHESGLSAGALCKEALETRGAFCTFQRKWVEAGGGHKAALDRGAPSCQCRGLRGGPGGPQVPDGAVSPFA